MLRRPIARRLLNGALQSDSSPQRYSCSGSECDCSQCCPTKARARRHSLTLAGWLEEHPYLEPIARLDAEINREVDGLPLGTASVPSWDLYFAEYVAGIPLLESQVAAIDLAPVEKALALIVGKLATKPLP